MWRWNPGTFSPFSWSGQKNAEAGGSSSGLSVTHLQRGCDLPGSGRRARLTSNRGTGGICDGRGDKERLAAALTGQGGTIEQPATTGLRAFPVGCSPALQGTCRHLVFSVWKPECPRSLGEARLCASRLHLSRDAESISGAQCPRKGSSCKWHQRPGDFSWDLCCPWQDFLSCFY